MSGTPFPHHDDSMYGIHRLLGVRYKMRIIESPFAMNKPLEPSHPFEQIKRRFYLRSSLESLSAHLILRRAPADLIHLCFELCRNTPESVGKEWSQAGGAFKFRVNTVTLNMSPVERGFYDEQARKVRTANIYSSAYMPLRQICDHPAANEGWSSVLQVSAPPPRFASALPWPLFP